MNSAYADGAEDGPPTASDNSKRGLVQALIESRTHEPPEDI